MRKRARARTCPRSSGREFRVPCTGDNHASRNDTLGVYTRVRASRVRETTLFDFDPSPPPSLCHPLESVSERRHVVDELVYNILSRHGIDCQARRTKRMQISCRGNGISCAGGIFQRP